MSGRCHDRSQHHHRHHGRSRSCSTVVVAVRVGLFSAATAAVLALYRQFRSIVHNFAPAYIRELDNGENSETNRAGRLAELRVAELYVFFSKSFDDHRGACVCDSYRECCI